jgi:methionyl-tRNA synthetase
LRAARAGDREAAEPLAAVLAVLLDACSVVAHELTPFLPRASERIAKALGERDPRQGRALFPKVETQVGN